LVSPFQKSQDLDGHLKAYLIRKASAYIKF